MKMTNVWFFILIIGAMPVQGYHKFCYLHPQYGRKGSLEDLKCIINKHFASDTSKPNYEVCSIDGRRTCHIRLSKTELAQAKIFFDHCTCAVDSPIADEMVQGLLNAKKTHLRTMGLVLRDFKYHNKNATVQQVRCALGLMNK